MIIANHTRACLLENQVACKKLAKRGLS